MIRKGLFLDRVIPLYFPLAALVALHASLLLLPLLGLLVGWDDLGGRGGLSAVFQGCSVVLWFVFGLAGWAWAIGVWRAGLDLRRRRNYRFCRTMSILLCLFFPFGTLAGGLVLWTLSSDRVKEDFAQVAAAEPASSAT